MEEKKDKVDDYVEHTFEEAATFLENGKFHLISLLSTGLALMAIGTEGLNMGFVLPSAKCQIEMTTTEQGLINAVAFIGVVLTSHFWGFMSDTWGRKKVLQVSLLSAFIFSAISSFSVNALMLMLTRFFVGLFISGVQASSVSYLGEFHCNKRRGKYVTLGVMFIPMSAVYQALMGVLILPMPWKLNILGLEYTPWRIYIFLSSFLTAVAFIALSFLPESPRFLLVMGKPDEALAIMKKVYSINTGRPQESYPVKAISLETGGNNLADAKGISAVLKLVWKQTWPLFKPPYLSNMLMLCYLQFVTYSASHGYYTWLPQILSYYYLNMEKPITICRSIELGVVETVSNATDVITEDACTAASSEPTTYYIILIMGCIFIFLYLLAAFNSNRYSMKFTLSIWLVLSAICAIALIWGNNFYLNMVLMTILMTCGNCGAIITAIAADLFPTHYKGMGLCVTMMFGRIGAVAGSNYAGALLYDFCNTIFIINSSLLIVSAGVGYVIVQRTFIKKQLDFK